jgi:precorrin-2 dehydrogenase/sirohydrochlorin ferrochelatase
VFYPLLVDLQGRRVLVIGGGGVAERKVDSLLEAGATVVLVSPETTTGIRDLGRRGEIEVRGRPFADSDLEGMALVISATDDPGLQAQATAAARSKGVWVNTVDQPDLCDFIVPAVLRRGDVIVAVSTSGTSPALAAALRRRLDGVVTENAARAARVLGTVRAEVQRRFPDSGVRKRVFEAVVDSGILDWIGECDDEAALRRVREMIAGFS